MHILLTDIATCPACGPTHGLILRADSIIDRRVRSGALGCPNCRRQYTITDGVADFTANSPPHPPATSESDDTDDAVRIAALLGLGEGSGFVLLVGPAARFAEEVADMTDGYEIIADATRAPASRKLSRIRIGSSIPFFAGKLRGIWLSGARATSLLPEAARVLHPLGRLVLEPAPRDARTLLADAGLDAIAQQDETLLAARR